MRRNTKARSQKRTPAKRRIVRKDIEPVLIVRDRIDQVRTRAHAAHLIAAYERMARDNLRYKDPKKRHSVELGEMFPLCYFAALKVKDDALLGRLMRASVPMIYENQFFIDRPKEKTKFQKFRGHVKRCRRRYRPGTWQMRLCVLAAFGWLMSCRWSDYNGTKP